MNITIYDHAVDNYLERILNVDREMVSDKIRSFCRKQIIEGIENPDEVLSKDKDMPPIYIKGDVAIIVATGKNEEGKYIYSSQDDKLIIPTVYPKETFIDDKYEKNNDEVVTGVS